MNREFSPSLRAQRAGVQPISELMSQALANPDLISLAAGFVDQSTLPVESCREAAHRLLADERRAREALQYGTTPGYVPLREWILQRQTDQDGGLIDAAPLELDQVVLTAGSNQLLHLIGESLLDPGDIVLCASPTYLVFLGTLANLGARAVGVACDGEGMIPEALEDRLLQLERGGELARVKAIYLVTYYDNPAGTTLPLARRARIVEIAKTWSRHEQIHVLADDAYRELRYEGDRITSMLALDDERDTVVLAGTFSKSYSPGIRVGWGILPRHLIEPVCSQKGNIDFGSPNFGQYLMAEVLEGGGYEPHLERIRAGYREKLAAMLAAADEHLAGLSGVSWGRPQGGLYVWLQLPEWLDAGPGGPLLDIAVREGVLYVPGQYCFPPEGEPVRANTIRLSFGVQPPDQIHRGMASLARALKQVT